MRRSVALGLGVALAAAAGLGALLATNFSRRQPRHATIVLESIGAEVFFLDAVRITRRGEPWVVAVRFSGMPELVPHHFAHDGLSEPRSIEAWAEHLGAPVVFNAGQFDEKREHLGWLKADGVWLSRRFKEGWHALLASGPLQGAAWSGIVDLSLVNPNLADEYRHAVQSMMLVDDAGRLRVRDTELAACRTVVAQDRKGRLLVLVSEGAVTLGDLGRWLSAAGLDVARAMNLDGGVESQLAIRTPELQLALYGQYGTGATVFEAGPQAIRYPLPAVIAVRPPRATARSADGHPAPPPRVPSQSP